MDEKTEPMTRSQDLHTPGLTKVIGSTAKGTIQLDCDVFIKTYREDCPQCQLWGPVIEQVAEALADVTTIVVGSYDVEKNHVHGLLTLEQTIYTPSLLLWPRNRKASPLDLSRGHSANAVITWLHQHSAGWFDLDKALARSSSLMPKTRTKLENVIRTQLEETPRPADHPCMDALDDLFIAYQLHQRLDLEEKNEEAIMQGHMGRYRKCVAKHGAPPIGGDDEKEEPKKTEDPAPATEQVEEPAPVVATEKTEQAGPSPPTASASA